MAHVVSSRIRRAKRDQVQIVPFPRVRQPIIDALHRASKTMSAMHALVEFDVTEPRVRIREHREKTGEGLSFTAFLVYCLARAVDENKAVQAYRKGRRLIIFDDVDVSVMVERDIDEQGKAPISPHVVKAANKKTVREIQAEIGAAKSKDASGIAKWTGRYWYLPRFVRSLLWRMWLGSSYWRKRLTGTVGLSSVGMFGKGAGWGIPVSTYTLSVLVGGIAEKPGFVEGRIAPRQYLSVTATFDHDVVDGAPAARFIGRLKEIVETGQGLPSAVGGSLT